MQVSDEEEDPAEPALDELAAAAEQQAEEAAKAASGLALEVSGESGKALAVKANR